MKVRGVSVDMGGKVFFEESSATGIPCRFAIGLICYELVTANLKFNHKTKAEYLQAEYRTYGKAANKNAVTSFMAGEHIEVPS